MIHIIKTKKAPDAIGPYSQGIDANNIVITSGQIPINPKTGEIISEDIALQTIQSLNNIKYILEKVKINIKNIIKTTIFMKNLNDFSFMNSAYKNFFKENNVLHYPARSCIEVSRLPKDAKIEIEALAIRN